MRSLALFLTLCAVTAYAVPVQVKNITSLNQVEDPDKVIMKRRFVTLGALFSI